MIIFFSQTNDLTHGHADGESQPITLFVGCVPPGPQIAYKAIHVRLFSLFVFPVLRGNSGFVSPPFLTLIKAEYFIIKLVWLILSTTDSLQVGSPFSKLISDASNSYHHAGMVSNILEFQFL